MTWSAIQRTYGNRKRGLSDATMNRHMAALKSLWDWARRQGHCEGDNPFDGFYRKLTPGRNVSPYVPWEESEIGMMLASPPSRRDLLEVILVGMHSGMRLDEIASLTWGQVQEEDGITYFQVEDAKTPAGNRQVPLHPALSWLKERTRGAPGERLWPAFNLEGPGKKPGADAGRDFSRYKTGLGFKSRTKAFHSFRKTVTRIMERAGVPENEWAQVFGHERGFTYRVYNPDGVTLARKAELMGLISYPTLKLPNVRSLAPPTHRPRRKRMTRKPDKSGTK
jgi:integrase